MSETQGFRDTEKLSFLSGANSPFISELYARYTKDPRSVDESWAELFAALGDDAKSIEGSAQGASWKSIPVIMQQAAPQAPSPVPQGVTGDTRQAALDSIRALMLIRAYRIRGHLLASLDPLELTKPHLHPDLDPVTWGFTESDYDRPIFLGDSFNKDYATLREILVDIKKIYCGTIGLEYMHLQDLERRVWIQNNVEKGQLTSAYSVEEKREILESLIKAEEFERYLHVKFTGSKRFGLDGGESFIPALESVIHHSAVKGVKDVVIGMAHRGRINVLANVMNKPYRAILAEFGGQSAYPEDVQGSGDVKYHLGTSADRNIDGHSIHLSLTANPSHLEAVNPVVVGKVRAKQRLHEDNRISAMGILVHGDAAFPGQGVVAETLCLSELKGYKTGGTIHIIINNQIGFTTSPSFSRSSPYPSDTAKMVQAPILHVNGDDPEAVVRVAKLAVDYRHQFKSDVVIDMFCYRRHGHNEIDEPSFTQPLMYKTIASHPLVMRVYADRLIKEGVITEQQFNDLIKGFTSELDGAFEEAKSYKAQQADWLEGEWKGMQTTEKADWVGKTGVALDILKKVGNALSAVPSGKKINSKIVRQLKAKEEMIASGEGIDWSTAEALAFGTLLHEGHSVRLSGQDSGRGTFSQRHAVLIDQETEERYIPLETVAAEGAVVDIIDSPLSEYAVLGFEYGYSLADPKNLVLWEAQFGDFANGAQIIVDQFIASAEIKWLRMSGLVMLLPHGYEGQGPEHSSARLERYLQLCAEENMQVINCTTPANYFHALRRQLHRTFRKPLIVMSPKYLLRYKGCVSALKDMGPKTHFESLIPEVDTRIATGSKVKRVVLSSGKIYYDLLEKRTELGLKDVPLIRVEQVYPFPSNELKEVLKAYPKAQVVWCQEEPKNQGAWLFVQPLIEEVLEALGRAGERPLYAGRAAAAATATGSFKKHVIEQNALIQEALNIK